MCHIGRGSWVRGGVALVSGSDMRCPCHLRRIFGKIDVLNLRPSLDCPSGRKETSKSKHRKGVRVRKSGESGIKS